MNLTNAYNQVGDFHNAFGHPFSRTPKPLSLKSASDRSGYKAEEIVELLFATLGNDFKLTESIIEKLHESIDNAKLKESEKEFPTSELEIIVAQSDALIDLIYFALGSLVEMGVKPEPLFNIVQEANMSKLWPDGKPRYREEDNKVLKPEGWQQPEPKLKKEIEYQIKESVIKNSIYESIQDIKSIRQDIIDEPDVAEKEKLRLIYNEVQAEYWSFEQKLIDLKMSYGKEIEYEIPSLYKTHN